jgi:hypothetical protein
MATNTLLVSSAARRATAIIALSALPMWMDMICVAPA